RMPDRQAGPVIRRARSARSLTSKHHYVASVTPPAFPNPFSPPPSTKNFARSEKRSLPRRLCCPSQRRPSDNDRPPAREEEDSGCVNTPRIYVLTN
ncbi:hypothetical protein K525DRAFT_214953, partial [Schizophyllum commune Loenen D]